MGPAEALLLIKPRLHHPFEYVSYTLAELLMIGVLQVETRQTRVHPNNPALVTYHFVKPGGNFHRYAPLPYQAFLTHEFHLYPEIPIHQLALRLKLSLGKLGKEDRYCSDYLKPHMEKMGLVPRYSWMLIHWYVPTGRGWKLRMRLYRDAYQIARSFPQWLTDDPDALGRCLATYGPILLMMPGLSFRTLAQIPDQLCDVSHLQSYLQQPSLYDWRELERLPSFGHLRFLETWLARFEHAYETLAVTPINTYGFGEEP
jgi:hypothetical protein